MTAKISVEAQLREEAAIQKRILDILTGKRRRTTPTRRRGISYYMQLCKQSTERLRSASPTEFRDAACDTPHGDDVSQTPDRPASAVSDFASEVLLPVGGSPVVSSMEDF